MVAKQLPAPSDAAGLPPTADAVDRTEGLKTDAHHGSCADDDGCSLNGVCKAGSCACDAGWAGSSCAVLDLLPTPAKRSAAYPPPDVANTTAWGGRGVFDEGTKQWHGWFAEMAGHCGPFHGWRSVTVGACLGRHPRHASISGPLGVERAPRPRT